MPFIRVIRTLPTTVGLVPAQSAYWDDYVDYIQTGTVADIPADAVYAALLDDAGKYKDVVQAPASFIFKHNFAGWDNTTWPYPS